MNVEAILQYISLTAYIGVLCSLPVRQKKLSAQYGACLLRLKHEPARLQYLVFVLCAALIILPRFRDFGTFVTIVLYLCAVIAAELVVRDILLKRFAGLYERALIVDGRCLPFDDIVSLPELAYKDSDAEEDEQYARALKIVSEKSGVIYVGFADREQKKQAVSLLLELVPRLAP